MIYQERKAERLLKILNARIEVEDDVSILAKMGEIEQLEEVKRWNRMHGYGCRLMAESAFSSMKRMFGEYVISIRWKNMVNELVLKASIYNTFISLALA